MATGETAAGQDAFLYEQIEREVADMIASGALEPGDRVPSLRRMSRQSGVSLATVMQAYLQLERKGLLEARPKSGFYVRRRSRPEPALPRSAIAARAPRRVNFVDTVSAVFAAAVEPGVVSLAVADPSPELLPVKGLTRALTRVAHQSGEAGLQYCFQPGNDDFRRQIALRYAELGCAVSPDEVLVTAGATEALALALQCVAKPGDVIAVESPAYFLVLRLIEQLGMLALEIHTESEHGIDLESLEQALEREPVRAVVTVANFHNPLGSLMPDEKKRSLVELVTRHRVPLIDDDIYGDLSFGDVRPAPLRRFDRDGMVLTCASFSKTLAPGYRIGWLLPGRFGVEAGHWKQTMTGATHTLSQLAVAEYLRTGSYDRHLRRARRVYRQQVERTRYAIAEHFPDGTRVSRPSGGFVLWVELPRGIDSEVLFRRCLERGVSITPGPLFSPTGRFRNYIRVCCGLPWAQEVERALRAVGEEASSLLVG